MNALVTAHLPVEGESPAPNVRVPAETAEPFTERDFRKEGPDPRAPPRRGRRAFSGRGSRGMLEDLGA